MLWHSQRALLKLENEARKRGWEAGEHIYAEVAKQWVGGKQVRRQGLDGFEHQPRLRRTSLTEVPRAVGQTPARI